mgnify:CR=1 FL=1
MSFLISDAMAQAAPAVQQPGFEGMLFPLGILVFFYFLFIRPQSKRNKEQKQMLAALSKGAEVVTSGGILGKVAELDDNFVKPSLIVLCKSNFCVNVGKLSALRNDELTTMLFDDST